MAFPPVDLLIPQAFQWWSLDWNWFDQKEFRRSLEALWQRWQWFPNWFQEPSLSWSRWKKWLQWKGLPWNFRVKPPLQDLSIRWKLAMYQQVLPAYSADRQCSENPPEKVGQA
jgi:hypothetical protein